MNKEQKKINTHKPQFDLKTHIRNGKGHIEAENHYRLTIVNGVKEFERPPGSGWIYDEAGTLKRSPKVKGEAKVVTTEKEFSNESLKRQIEELKAELAAKKEDEVHMTVQDVTVDDVQVSDKVDYTEEIQLMKDAGAIEDAQKLEQIAAVKKPAFNKTSFMK